jgi:DNA-binding winged helix-turn-helix (wHTH) protein
VESVPRILAEDFVESLVYPWEKLVNSSPSGPSGPAVRETVVEFAFGNQVLDVDRRELRRGDDPVAVEPQVFDLLVYLVRSRDRVVSKDDLIANVWGGWIVSESTLTSHIHAARKAVGDSGEAQRLIRLPRKGFRPPRRACRSS